MEVSAPSSTDFIAQCYTCGRINTRSTRPSTAGTHSSHSTSPSIASLFSIMAPQAGSSTLHVVSTSANPGSSSHNTVLPVSSHAAYWQNGVRVFWRAILLSAQFAARKLLIFKAEEGQKHHKREALPWWIFALVFGIATAVYIPKFMPSQIHVAALSTVMGRHKQSIASQS